MTQSLSYLIQRLKPYWLGDIGSASVTEGPGIDIIAPAQVGLGGDTILIYNNDGTPVEEFDFTHAGLVAALAAADSGDTVLLPNGTLTVTDEIVVPAGVTLQGTSRNGSIIYCETNEVDDVIELDEDSSLKDCTIDFREDHYIGGASGPSAVWCRLGGFIDNVKINCVVDDDGADSVGWWIAGITIARENYAGADILNVYNNVSVHNVEITITATSVDPSDVEAYGIYHYHTAAYDITISDVTVTVTTLASGANGFSAAYGIYSYPVGDHNTECNIFLRDIAIYTYATTSDPTNEYAAYSYGLHFWGSRSYGINLNVYDVKCYSYATGDVAYATAGRNLVGGYYNKCDFYATITATETYSYTYGFNSTSAELHACKGISTKTSNGTSYGGAPYYSYLYHCVLSGTDYDITTTPTSYVYACQFDTAEYGADPYYYPTPQLGDRNPDRRWIHLYDSAGTLTQGYIPNYSGLVAALAASTSGDVVSLPPMNITITAAITIPAGVTLKGTSRETSTITFSGAATGTFSLITVGTNSVFSDCTVNATYTNSTDNIKTVYVNQGCAHRLTITSTLNAGVGAIYSFYGQPYETDNTVRENITDIIGWSTTKVDYNCYGIWINHSGNGNLKRSILRNLYGYAILEATVTNYHGECDGLYIHGNSVWFQQYRLIEGEYAYFAQGDNTQVFDSYGFARVHNADSVNGGARAYGINAEFCTIHNSHGYGVSADYSLAHGIGIGYVTLRGCIGQSYGNDDYIVDYDQISGITSSGVNALYNCIGLAQEDSSSANMAAVGFYVGQDFLVGCTAKVTAENGAVPLDVKFWDYCFLDGNNFETIAPDDPDNPKDLIILNGDRNYRKFTTITGDKTLDGSYDLVYVDATGGNIVVKLPAVDEYKRREYIIKRIDASANTVTLNGDGALIDLLATQALNSMDSIVVHSDGTGWWIL